MNKEETLIVSRKEYEHLLDQALFLQLLEDAGLDQWDGYSYAQHMYTAAKRQVQEIK